MILSIKIIVNTDLASYYTYSWTLCIAGVEDGFSVALRFVDRIICCTFSGLKYSDVTYNHILYI